MLLNGFNRPLHLDLKVSRLILYYLCLVHVLALLSIVLAALPVFYTSLLLTVVTFSMLLHLRKYKHQTHGIPDKWIYPSQSEWLEVLPNKTKRWKQIKAYQVTGLFSVVVLNNLANNHRKHLLLVHDQIEKATFRRLQVILSARQRYATVNEDSLA